MEKNKVSIIVPCYNQAAFLTDTLESVLASDYQNWECIIVNDGSTDNTIEIAEIYSKKDNRFILFTKSNGGLADARNFGIRNAEGIYVLPLDADDLIHPEYIKKSVKILDGNVDIEIVYSRANLFGCKNGEWKLPEFSEERMLARNCIFCSAIFRRSTFFKTNGYNQNLKYGFQDWDLWLSILELGGKVNKIDEILFYYRQKSKSMINTKTPEQFVHLRKMIWENHRNLYSKYCIYPSESFELQLILESNEYRIGRLFRPFFPFLRLFRNIIYSWKQ